MTPVIKCITFVPLYLMLAMVPSYGLTLTFAPPGAQIDADPILDIATAVGNPLVFNVFATIPAGGVLNAIEYGVSFDDPVPEAGEVSELVLNVRATTLDPGGLFAGGSFLIGPPGGVDVGAGDFRIGHLGGAIAGGGGPRLLDIISFTVGPALISDGIRDFGFAAFVAIGAGLGGPVSIQIVEVQPRRVPEPSTLLLLGLGLAAAAARNRTNSG
jgi:hypothetical protein